MLEDKTIELNKFIKEQLVVLNDLVYEMDASCSNDMLYTNSGYLETKINFYIKLHDYLELTVLRNNLLKNRESFYPLIKKYCKISTKLDRQIRRFDKFWPV